MNCSKPSPQLRIAIGVRLEKEKGESDNRHSAPTTLGVPTADSLIGFMSLLISRFPDFSTFSIFFTFAEVKLNSTEFFSLRPGETVKVPRGGMG